MPFRAGRLHFYYFYYKYNYLKFKSSHILAGPVAPRTGKNIASLPGLYRLARKAAGRAGFHGTLCHAEAIVFQVWMNDGRTNDALR
jgi:hypothetical protein